MQPAGPRLADRRRRGGRVQGHLVALGLGGHQPSHYKHRPNHVILADGTRYAYAPVDRTGEEMHRLMEELRASAFEVAHPAVQAAYAHHALVAVHPFADGNGRVARVLASVFLLRAISLPLVIFADQRPAYLAALRAADLGRLDAFSSFVFDRALDTVLLVTEQLRGSRAGSSTLEALGALGSGGDTGLGLVAERLRSLVSSELKAQLEALELPKGMTATAWVGLGRGSDREDWRRVHGSDQPGVWLESAPPAAADIEGFCDVLVATNPEERFPLAVEWVGTDDLLPVRLSDVHPMPSTALELRLRAWVRRHVHELLAQLLRQTQS